MSSGCRTIMQRSSGSLTVSFFSASSKSAGTRPQLKSSRLTGWSLPPRQGAVDDALLHTVCGAVGVGVVRRVAAVDHQPGRHVLRMDGEVTEHVPAGVLLEGLDGGADAVRGEQGTARRLPRPLGGRGGTGRWRRRLRIRRGVGCRRGGGRGASGRRAGSLAGQRDTSARSTSGRLVRSGSLCTTAKATAMAPGPPPPGPRRACGPARRRPGRRRARTRRSPGRRPGSRSAARAP